MAWTETCKIDFQKQVEHKKEQGYKTKDALVELSNDSGIPIGTLKDWLYPESRKRSDEKRQEKKLGIPNFPENLSDEFDESRKTATFINDVSLSDEFEEIDKAAHNQKLQIVKEFQEEKKEVREQRREEKVDQFKSAGQIELPNKKYQIILADPPWKYDFSTTNSREIENKYPTMSLEEIINLEVEQISMENSVLFLWATAPKLLEAVEVMKEWGFEYKTHAIWDKEIIGMGYYFRGQHELLLLGTKGNLPTPAPEKRVSSVIRDRRTTHSTKPLVVHEIIENMYPSFTKVELFARKSRVGWESWGNEIND